MTTSSPRITSLLSLALISVAGIVHAEWRQFRGPNSTGISQEKHALPVEFSASKNVKWTQKLGDGVG